MADTKNTKQAEVDRNYAAFVKALPGLVNTHAGKYALMRNGEIVEFFDTGRDAVLAGRQMYPDGLFSVQEVTGDAVDLGYFSHAFPLG